MMFYRGRLLLLSLLAENQRRSISFLDYSANTQLGLLHFKDLLFANSNRPFSSISTDTDKQSLTVSYLINSCGLSPDSAKSASKNVLLSNTKNPDSMLSLFRDHGLTDHQISRVIARQPRLLMFNARKIVLPKLEFLRSIGFSSQDLSTLISKRPQFMTRSLNKTLIPLYDMLKTLFLSDDQVVATLKRFTTRLNLNYLTLNISTLREIGVPPSTISSSLARGPNFICVDADKFNQAVAEVVEMGFHPKLHTFAVALKTKITLSKGNWKCKIHAFKKWGIPEDEVLAVFRKHPPCMTLSEESIHNKMSFLVQKMGWQPADVLQNPIVICYSLEERIVPRCLIIKILHLKGLINRKISLNSIIQPSDDRFLDMYVDKHTEQLPELLDIFEGKMNLEEQGFGFL